MIDTDRITTAEARIEFLDAWTEWDDACLRQMAVKGKPSALTLRRETLAHEATLKVICIQLGMRSNVVQHLLAALRQAGFDREPALRAVEAIAVDLRQHQ